MKRKPAVKPPLNKKQIEELRKRAMEHLGNDFWVLVDAAENDTLIVETVETKHN